MSIIFNLVTAPAISEIGQPISNTLQQNEVTFLQVSLPQEGTTLRLDVSQGSVVMYGSSKIQNPNEAFYDFKLSNSIPELYVNQETFGQRITKRAETPDDTDITIYITIQGQSVLNDFTLNTTIGDTTAETAEPSTAPTTSVTTDVMVTGTKFEFKI